jgi:hypothetical protein
MLNTRYDAALDYEAAGRIAKLPDRTGIKRAPDAEAYSPHAKRRASRSSCSMLLAYYFSILYPTRNTVLM